jgi:hypothetical protein
MDTRFVQLHRPLHHLAFLSTSRGRFASGGRSKQKKKVTLTLTPCRRNRSAPGRLRIDSENTPVTTDNSADAKKKKLQR